MPEEYYYCKYDYKNSGEIPSYYPEEEGTLTLSKVNSKTREFESRYYKKYNLNSTWSGFDIPKDETTVITKEEYEKLLALLEI
jgi:hypothetical protein